MKHKAKTWNYCWPDDPQPGLLHLEPPALSGEATFWIQCGGGTSEEQNKIADRIAALWNMAERLGLSTEEIENGKIDKAFYKLEELELMIERGDLLNEWMAGRVDKAEAAIRTAEVDGERYCHSEYGSANCKWEPGVGCTPKCPECIP